jgi:molybdenum cofactor synthesis domain-containing protein
VFELWTQPLDVLSVMAAVERPQAGACHIFVGRVRDHDAGHAVSRLEYQAYSPMAEEVMASIAQTIERSMAGVKLAAIHRVGELQVGELAVVCAASAPHRSEAFAACRQYVEELKRTVPIWKRQWGPSGPYWVGWDGTGTSPSADRPPCNRHGQALESSAVERRDHAHPAAAPTVAVAAVTVSDTRSDADDVSGSVLREELAAWGHRVVTQCVVPDDPEGLRACALGLLETVDAVIVTGGTGITARDRTYEALQPLIERQLDGFGETFRRLSWEQIGPRALLSRAFGGTYRGRILMALPGSPNAVRLGVRHIVGPLLGHAVAMAKS